MGRKTLAQRFPELVSKPRSHYVAWLLTVGALWVFERSYNFAPLFQIPGEVIALEATLIVLIWTAYHTYQGVLHGRRLADREDAAGILSRTSLCIALASEVSILREGLDVATRDMITAEEASRFLPRPLLRHALERSDLFSPQLASQITAVEGGLSMVEANLRTRDRLTDALDKVILTVGREQQLRPELAETEKRLGYTVGNAKGDLEALDDLLFEEINRREPVGVDSTLDSLSERLTLSRWIRQSIDRKR